MRRGAERKKKKKRTSSIRRLCRKRQSLHPQDTSNRREETESKHEHHRHLLRLAQVRHENRVHGQRQYQNVGADAESRIGVPVDRDVDAGSRDGLVPGSRDGCALPDRGAEGGNHVGADDAHEDVTCYPEPSLDEDAQVEEEDGGFCEVDGDFVEGLSYVEELCGCRIVLVR